MTNHSSRKKQITKILTRALAEKNIPIDGANSMVRIWMSGRQDRGMRLTDEGMVLFGKAELQHYDYPIGDLKDYPLVKFRLDVSKHIDCPYYLWQKQGPKLKESYIRVYDHKIATILSLYGNLVSFLQVKEK